MEYLRTVLRNRATRKDAASVIVVRAMDASSMPKHYEVVTYYGPWTSYETDPENLMTLRLAPKFSSPSLSSCHRRAAQILAEKESGGYIRQKYHPITSESKSELFLEPEPEPKPKSTLPMVQRLLARTR